MKWYFNSKADLSKGYFQFGLSGKPVVQTKSNIAKFPWHIGGWYWPMGISVSLGFIHFIWYTKKLLKLRHKYNWLEDNWHWYGAFTTRGWK